MTVICDSPLAVSPSAFTLKTTRNAQLFFRQDFEPGFPMGIQVVTWRVFLGGNLNQVDLLWSSLRAHHSNFGTTTGVAVEHTLELAAVTNLGLTPHYGRSRFRRTQPRLPQLDPPEDIHQTESVPQSANQNGPEVHHTVRYDWPVSASRTGL